MAPFHNIPCLPNFGNTQLLSYHQTSNPQNLAIQNFKLVLNKGGDDGILGSALSHVPFHHLYHHHYISQRATINTQLINIFYLN